MSVANRDSSSDVDHCDSDAYTCEHCGTCFSDPTYGSYCSQLCDTRAKGRKVLNQIESDRRICNTCYGQVRDTRPPTESTPDCFAGFQSPTSRTTYGVDDFATDPDKELLGTRWSCECGAVDPNATIAELQNVDLSRVIQNCLRAMAFLADEGAIANHPDPDRYLSALQERLRDAEYACGTAVYG